MLINKVFEMFTCKEIKLLGKYIPVQILNPIVGFLKMFSDKLNGLRNVKELERIFMTKTNISNFFTIFSLVIDYGNG